MSAHYYGTELKRSKRFLLGEELGRVARHTLLMTATPHAGKPDDFQLFLSLLDQDRFAGKAPRAGGPVDTTDVMRRMVKESLLTFEGKPLFPERKAETVPFELSEGNRRRRVLGGRIGGVGGGTGRRCDGCAHDRGARRRARRPRPSDLVRADLDSSLCPDRSLDLVGAGLIEAGIPAWPDAWHRYHERVTTKERLHKLVDELSDQEAEAALVIVERRRDDPMLQALASAPLDDEPSDSDEDASADEALAAYRRGEGVSSDDLRSELDLG